MRTSILLVIAAVSVWGALEEYDWTDLIPAPAGTGKEKTTCR